MINHINGDLLTAKEKYIAHQCNCVSNSASGLAGSIFRKYKYSDIYLPRLIADEPGTIVIKGDGKEQRFVINMLAQYYPGISRYPNSPRDGIKAREQYFAQCLDKIANIPELDSIAFPYMIGCGLAGGDWNSYLKMIEDFAYHIEMKQSAIVSIYKL
jgi:O-acetyl-ADP-ribose deacetylase (regulator of RNase III)